VFLALALSFPAAAAAQYEVKIEPGTRNLLLQFALSPDDGHPIKLVTRGAAWGLQPQVEDVKCGQVALHRDSDGDWIAPPGCSRVSWRVTPDSYDDRGIDPSKQRTLAIGRTPWFLLAEATSLLRPLESSEQSSIGTPGSERLLGATSVGLGRFLVPPASKAPEFYVLGAVATGERAVGEFHVVYVADVPDRVRRLGLDRLHGEALSYLSSVVPLPTPTSDSSRKLLVIWLGVARGRGTVGGAAGHRSFVANYLVGPPPDKKRNAAMTLAIVAHEQFHQLVDIARGRLAPLPVWLSESLAQYYGLKALLRTGDSKYVRAVRRDFINPSRNVTAGLVELNRRYEAGDRAGYDRFYTQGATLWNAIDSAIVAATSGRQSLDDYVKDILLSPIPKNGTLPAVFVERLRSVAGSEIDRIIAKYVGR